MIIRTIETELETMLVLEMFILTTVFLTPQIKLLSLTILFFPFTIKIFFFCTFVLMPGITNKRPGVSQICTIFLKLSHADDCWWSSPSGFLGAKAEFQLWVIFHSLYYHNTGTLQQEANVIRRCTETMGPRKGMIQGASSRKLWGSQKGPRMRSAL